ncbi:MAG: flagellar basal body L-ring protein FlgH [Armatimonadota bacterium]
MLSKYVKVLAIMLILLPFTPAAADSLWVATSPGSMFTDIKAKQVGDLITILISEGTSSSVTASKKFDKSLEHSNSGGVGTLLKMIPDMGFTSEQEGSTTGQSAVSTSLTANVTAKVTKVLPNGNLEIQAQRTIYTNEEKQEITVTGIVRPQDISADNTVSSTYLSDVTIKQTGKGAIGDRQKEGIISKIVRYLF